MSPSAVISLLWPKNLCVLEAFVNDNPGTVIVAFEDPAAPHQAHRIEAAGGEFLSLGTLLSPAERARAGAESKVLVSRLESVLDSSDWLRSTADRGWSGEHLAPIICRRAQTDLPKLVLTLAALEHACSRCTPRLVIVNEDFTPIHRAVVLWARERGLPSLHLEHSLTLVEPYAVHGRIVSDALALFGESGAEAYLDGGSHAPTGRVRVTGNPAWDRFAEMHPRRRAIRDGLAGRYDCPPSRPWVVFATTWGGGNWPARADMDVHTKTLRLFLEACKTLIDAGSEIAIIVKDRPSNQAFGEQVFAGLVAEIGLDTSHVRYAKDDIADWVIAADVVVSAASNVSVEALLASTPAVNLVTEMDMTMGPMFDAGSGIVEAEGHELVAVLDRILNDPAHRDELRALMREAAPRYNAGVDGAATTRVVSLMEELALPADTPLRPRTTAGLY